MRNLTTITKEKFTKKLDDWHEEYKEFKINNTTNAIDGEVFSPIFALSLFSRFKILFHILDIYVDIFGTIFFMS